MGKILPEKKVDSRHHYFVFFNLYNHQIKYYNHKSDLIGNGLLTYYHFTLPGIKLLIQRFFLTMQELKRGFVRTIKMSQCIQIRHI